MTIGLAGRLPSNHCNIIICRYNWFNHRRVWNGRRVYFRYRLNIKPDLRTNFNIIILQSIFVEDEQKAESQPTINGREEWPSYERGMLNLAKRYGRVCEMMMKNEEPKFEVQEHTSSRASSAENALWLEESKLVLKEKKRVRAALCGVYRNHHGEPRNNHRKNGES